MNRSSIGRDWRPLADADPVPGDPGLVRRLATQEVRAAALAAEQASAVRRVVAALAGGGADAWSGPAAEAFLARVGSLPRDLDRVAARQHRVALALLAYAPELESAQRQAGRALDTAHHAQARAGVAVGSTVGLPPTWLPSALTPAERELAAAIADGRRRLAAAVEHRDRAVARCARALDAAGDDQLRDPHGWRHVLQTISAAAGTVSTWLGVAAVLLCPVPGVGQLLGAVALTAAALTLLSDLALAAYGDKGWSAIGVDLTGVLPAGRALRIASTLPHEVTQARAVARAAARVDLVGDLQAGARDLGAASRVRTWPDLLRSPGGLLDDLARARELRRGGAAVVLGGHALDAGQAGLGVYAALAPAAGRGGRP